MRFMFQNVIFVAVLFGLSSIAQAQDTDIILSDLNLNIELHDSDILLAGNKKAARGMSAPNIPDSAFKKPFFTANNMHMYLGLASMGFGALAGVSASGASGDPDLLNTVHYKAAKAAWQFGALAVGSGLYAHWNDFHLSDGLFDRDNLHALLGLVGTVGYYLAVKTAVDDYNAGLYPSESHSSVGTIGGGAMLTAIVITW